MSAYLRVITVNGSGNGGRAAGVWLKDGSSFEGKPTLVQGDTLQVAVEVNGNAPAGLDGYLIVAAAAAAPPAQTDASPFTSGNNQICVRPYTAVAPVANRFTFAPAMVVPGTRRSSPRQFELAFVAVDPVSGKQWAEDPEFDTGN